MISIVEVQAAYLRDVLEGLSKAAGLSPDTSYGPKSNDALLHDLHRWIGGIRCRHCGAVGIPGEDHSCSCPLHDNDCTEHPDPNYMTARDRLLEVRRR